MSLFAFPPESELKAAETVTLKVNTGVSKSRFMVVSMQNSLFCIIIH